MALSSKCKNYPLYAWRDNRIRLKATQGEGGIKIAQFTLLDDNGAINLSSATSVTFDGIKRNGQGCCINCEIVDAANGIIEFVEQTGITDIDGNVNGTINVVSADGNIKFDGIILYVAPNNTTKLIEASQAFSAFVEALNKLALITPEGTIAIDDVLTDDGVNAVQGKVIKAAIDKKLDNSEGSVKRENIEINAVGSDEIDSGAVDTTHLSSKSVTTEKLSDEVVNEINKKSDKSDSLAGYGITDAYTKTEVDNELSAKSDLFLKHSKNLVKLADVDTIINGLRIVIKNNHIKLKGTATTAITSWISADERPEIYESGVIYTGSAQNVVDNLPTQSVIGIRFNYSADGHMAIGNTDKSLSFTPNTEISGDNARLAWNIPKGEYDKEFDLMLEYGSEMTPFEPYLVVENIGNNTVSYDKLDVKMQARFDNVKSKISQFEFKDITETETGYYYGSFTHNTDGNWECTPTPIPCVEGDIFRISASMYDIDNHQQIIKCYDAAKNLIGSYCGVIEEGKSAHYNNKIFVVPEGVAYVAFNCWIAMSGVRLKVEKAVPIIDLASQIANGLLDETPSKMLYRKSMYSDGDSIADGAGSNGVSYAHLLRDKYNMTLTDRAVGGTTIAVQGGRTDSIYERITSMTGDYDYILFEGGTNDVSKSIRLGEITDGVNAEFDTSTVLGALEGICQFLNTNYFNAQKLFIFVNKRVDEHFNKTNETFAKMKEVLKKWGIPYVDIGNVTNLGNWNDTVPSDYFLADKLHPTLKAYKKFYLPYVEKALMYGGYINT